MAGDRGKAKKKSVKVGKNLDVSKARTLQEKLRKLVQQGIIDLTLDMKGVEKLDSMGLCVILATQNSMAAAGGQLFLKNVSENLFQLFKTIHLDRSFEFKSIS